MQRLEELKQELIKQKEIITKKGGKVTVLNNNPSPSEITAGINSIISSNIDFSLANAKNEDVKKGKTYYDNAGELQTGNYEDLGYTLFLYNKSQVDSQTEYQFVIPSYMTEVRDCLFYDFPCKLKIKLDPQTTLINYQSLYTTIGQISIENFNELTILSQVGDYALAGVKGIDLSHLPKTLTTLGKYALKDTYYGQTTIDLSNKFSSCNDGCFSASEDKKATLSSGVFSGIPYIIDRMFSNVYFNFHFDLPEQVKIISGYAFFGGGVKSMTFHKNLTSIGKQAFYSLDDKAYTEYIVFLGEKPPTVNTLLFSNLHTKSFNIYVPDNAVADYKKTFSIYNILPMSEKP